MVLLKEPVLLTLEKRAVLIIKSICRYASYGLTHVLSNLKLFKLSKFAS